MSKKKRLGIFVIGMLTAMFVLIPLFGNPLYFLFD